MNSLKKYLQNLADEIKDLLDQLGEGGRSIHDLVKQRRRLEQEKEELQGALEEAEGTLGLLKSSLKLFLLDLEPPPLFVQLVDGTAAIAKLVEQILDLVGEVLKISI